MKVAIVEDKKAFLGRDLVVAFDATRYTRGGEFSAGVFVSRLGVAALAGVSVNSFSQGQNLAGAFFGALAIANAAAQASFGRTVDIEDYKKAEQTAPTQADQPQVVQKTTPPALIA